MAFWNNTRVLVTEGASFVGSRLVEELVAAGATVRVADNLSSGKLAHIQQLIDRGSVKFMQACPFGKRA